MNQKVTNPKTEVPTTPEMNDKDYLSVVLEGTKNLVNNYSYALNEMSNNTLCQEIDVLFKDTHAAQRDLFNLMFEKGWYSLEKAEDNKIMQKYNEYSNQMNELVG